MVVYNVLPWLVSVIAIVIWIKLLLWYDKWQVNKRHDELYNRYKNEKEVKTWMNLK